MLAKQVKAHADVAIESKIRNVASRCVKANPSQRKNKQLPPNVQPVRYWGASRKMTFLVGTGDFCSLRRYQFC